MIKKIIKKHWVVCTALIIFLILIAVVAIKIINIPCDRQNGTRIYYEGTEFSSNGSYNGIIDTDKEEVIISDQSGKEVSHIDIEEHYPHQIVLGNNNYFLLYRQDNSGAKIVQYDYQSVKKKEYSAENVAVIACKNGYLFMGDWEYDGEDWHYFDSCYYGFYANKYIKEEEFGNEPIQLKNDSTGRCFVGDMEMYYHEDGYFTTEPVLNDYKGTSEGSFRASDKNYQAKTKQEMKNRTLLLSQIGKMQGVYDVFEYQLKDTIYGVCNFFEDGKYIPSHPTETQDVKATYFYKINPEENEITILLKKDSCIGLILSDHVAVYQQNNVIISHDLSTGNTETIYTIKNEHGLRLEVKEDYLMVVEEKKRIFPSIFPTEEEITSMIKWNIL